MEDALEVVLWALGTGLITGAVWTAIVLVSRQRTLADQQRIMIEDVARRSVLLDQMEQRLAEVEERLDFAERLLPREPGADRPTPPSV